MIPGTMASATSCQYSSAIAHELALLIERLRAVDTRGRSFGGSGRGGVLSDHDVWSRNASPEVRAWSTPKRCE